MITLHPSNPEWLLVTGKQLSQTRNEVWPYFLEFCLKRNPLPEFHGSFSEKQAKIVEYFKSTFTLEKDLALRAYGNLLTGFVLFDPQNWSLVGDIKDRTVELVIAGSLCNNPWTDAKDFKTLITAYKNYKGCNYIGMNIRREWKGEKFKSFCQRLGFKESGGLFLL